MSAPEGETIGPLKRRVGEPVFDEPWPSHGTWMTTSLKAARDALDNEALFRDQFGDVFMDDYLRLTRNELGRFLSYLEEQGSSLDGLGDETTQWEQNEYFDFF